MFLTDNMIFFVHSCGKYPIVNLCFNFKLETKLIFNLDIEN